MLAQLKQEYGSNREAIELFEEIVKLKTPYEMEFQARMQQALAFDRRRGDSMEIKELFFDMLEEDKNEDYRDQIYYALAQIELEELNREQGMDYLRDALAENSGNRRPRMKSLGLADLHLEDREYELAQAYYDSTLANMDEDHPRYQEVSNNAKSLTELVEQLMVIVRNDSLRHLQLGRGRPVCADGGHHRRPADCPGGCGSGSGTAGRGSVGGDAWPCREPRRRSGLTTPR